MASGLSCDTINTQVLEPEHFSSQIKRARHSNYTLENGLKEFCDNVIKKAKHINIATVLDNNGYLQKIIISDDYIQGFIGINNQGRHNPFNMGCINTSHEDDDETSEFGLGLKTACIALGNEMEVFTKVDKTYNVRFNFRDMKTTDNVTLSYQPEYLGTCDTKQYEKFHPWETGSTIIIKDTLKTIYPKTTIEELETKLIKCLGETYGRLLFSENNSDGCQLSVNNKPVAPGHDYYQDEKCKPFTTIYNICVLTKEEIIDSEIRTTEIFYRKKINGNVTYMVYDGKWKKTSEQKCIEDINKYTVMYGSTWSIEIESTFVLYSDKFLTKPQEDDLDLLPKDGVLIYKDKRLYSKNAIKRHNNGSHNYTQHSIKFKSKQIGKILGITYNKTFSMDQENDLTTAIKTTIDINRKCFNADTSSTKYSDLYKIAERKKLILDNDWRCYKNKSNTISITGEDEPHDTLSVTPTEFLSELVTLDDQTSLVDHVIPDNQTPQVMVGGTTNITPPLSPIATFENKNTVAPTDQVNNNMSNTDNTNSQISLPINHIPANDPNQNNSREFIINQHSDNGEHIDDCIQDINECSKKKEEELAEMKTKLLSLLDRAKSSVISDTYQEEVLDEINEVYSQLSIIYG